MVEKNGIPLNVIWECIQNMPNGDDLIMWPFAAGHDDDDTSGFNSDLGGFDDDYQSPYAYEPEEVPDVLGDLLDIDFLKRWI